jgi:hypothetical protein
MDRLSRGQRVLDGLMSEIDRESDYLKALLTAAAPADSRAVKLALAGAQAARDSVKLAAGQGSAEFIQAVGQLRKARDDLRRAAARVERRAAGAPALSYAAGRWAYRDAREVCGQVRWMIDQLEELPANLRTAAVEAAFGHLADARRCASDFPRRIGDLTAALTGAVGQLRKGAARQRGAYKARLEALAGCASDLADDIQPPV